MRDFPALLRNMTDEQRDVLFRQVSAQFQRVEGITEQDIESLRGVMLTESNGGLAKDRAGSAIKGPFQINTNPETGVKTDLVQAGLLSRRQADDLDVQDPLNSAYMAALYWQLNKQRVGDNQTNLALAYNVGPTAIRAYQRLKVSEQQGFRGKMGAFEGGEYKPTPTKLSAEENAALRANSRNVVVDPTEFTRQGNFSPAKTKEILEYVPNVQNGISAINGVDPTAPPEQTVFDPATATAQAGVPDPLAEIAAAAGGVKDKVMDAVDRAKDLFNNPVEPSAPTPPGIDSVAGVTDPTRGEDPLANADAGPPPNSGAVSGTNATFAPPLPSENPQLLGQLAALQQPVSPQDQMVNALQLQGAPVDPGPSNPIANYLDYLLSYAEA